MLEHSVLMNARLVGKGVLADDRLVVLDRKIRDVGNELGGPRQHLGIDPGGEGHGVAAYFQRHDDFFQRGVAGALTDAVDRAFDLARACLNPGE